MELPVTIRTKKIDHTLPTVHIFYPSVDKLENHEAQLLINRAIVTTFNKLLIEQHFYNENLAEMQAYFEIKTNQRGILSLNLIVYSFLKQHAHGLTIIKSLTFDTKTGKQYTLADFFIPRSNYVEKLSSIISQKIVDWKVQLLGEFKGIRPDQDYYIADTVLVIYFQLYEITPYYWGFPYFPIPILDLAEIIQPNSPLDTMMSFY